MSASGNAQDPWMSTDHSDYDHNVKLEFEDAFIQKPSFQPLDDSQTYLATLERKLLVLNHGKVNQQEKQLVSAAEETRNSYMCRLIAGESRESLNVNQNPELDTVVTPSLVCSWLNPEQPLTVGELAELLKNDSVALNTQDTDKS